MPVLQLMQDARLIVLTSFQIIYNFTAGVTGCMVNKRLEAIHEVVQLL